MAIAKKKPSGPDLIVETMRVGHLVSGVCVEGVHTGQRMVSRDEGCWITAGNSTKTQYAEALVDRSLGISDVHVPAVHR